MPTSITQRAITVGLISIGKTIPEVSELLQIPISIVRRIYIREIQRGFDPNSRSINVFNEFVADVLRSGRPRK